MQWVHGLHFNNLKGDLFGGITAAIVALPLALAFGVSSGAGPVAGMYGAIFVGLFAALFGGAPSQVSGPTGPMTVVMAGIFTHFVALDPVSGPAMALEEVIIDSHLAAQNEMIVGARPEVERILQRMRVATLIPDNYHFPDRTAALDAAAKLLSTPDSEL